MAPGRKLLLLVTMTIALPLLVVRVGESERRHLSALVLRLCFCCVGRRLFPVAVALPSLHITITSNFHVLTVSLVDPGVSMQ